jgi:hypothetical protein
MTTSTISRPAVMITHPNGVSNGSYPSRRSVLLPGIQTDHGKTWIFFAQDEDGNAIVQARVPNPDGGVPSCLSEFVETLLQDSEALQRFINVLDVGVRSVDKSQILSVLELGMKAMIEPTP